jgi:hypothetical protein
MSKSPTSARPVSGGELKKNLPADTKPDAKSAGAGQPQVPSPASFTPEDASRLRDMATRIASTFGEIIALLMRSPHYRYAFISDLEWMVMPAISSGQLVLGEARHKETGVAAPVAVIMWACVSDEVDARLTAAAGQPMPG